MTILFFVVFLGYFLTMSWIALGFLKLPSFSSAKLEPKTGFSIIIPFRNEAENLPVLLQSLQQLNYPEHLYEILLVDDASEDGGPEMIQQAQHDMGYAAKIIQNKRISASPKKDAIVTAIDIAKYDWILTTDADCQVPQEWLQLINNFIIQEDPKMICGPVVYHTDRSLLGSFQFLDGLSLQATTIGGFGWQQPLLCNGANLGYRKDAFHEVSGYQGNNHIASGDDIFLLEKMHKHFPGKVKYIKNAKATVTTEGETSLKEVVSQRTRWASKTSKQKSNGIKLLGIIVLLANLFFILSLIGLASGLHWDYSNSTLFRNYMFQKICVDLIVITVAASFFKRPFPVLHYFVNSLFYPMVLIWVTVKSLSGSYTWKGREIKK